MRSWVAATENLLVIELSVKGDPGDANPFAPTALTGVEVKLWPMSGNEAETASGNLPDGYWAVRRFVSTTNTIALERKPSARTTEAAVAMRLIGHREPGLPWSRGDGWSADRFVLQPGRVVYVVASVVTREDAADPLAEAQRRVENWTREGIDGLRERPEQLPFTGAGSEPFPRDVGGERGTGVRRRSPGALAGHPGSAESVSDGGGGGIENCSGVPATINEMLVQAHQGVLRVFPVWPRDRAASFGRLRTPGAFLVSAELRDGQVGSVVVESERGRRCRLVTSRRCRGVGRGRCLRRRGRC